GKKAQEIFIDFLPEIVQRSLRRASIDRKKLKEQLELVVDQQAIRDYIKEHHLVSFIANGSILPRESGISQKPMSAQAVPFFSPKELEVTVNLPNKGPIAGMGIPEGVTLIVGGGFHGKSTLLKAVELGIYDHVKGDGREYVATTTHGVRIKAEEGRNVENVDISPFLNNLPLFKDTEHFTTENASGSTSQGANIMECLEAGAKALFIDEDTSATNFMIRDGRMQRLIRKEKEPITPFIDQVRPLYEKHGVSTLLVIGGSGDYFEWSDRVIAMEEYIPRDVTREAKEIVETSGRTRMGESPLSMSAAKDRIVLRDSFPKDRKGVKIKTRGKNHLSYNKTDVDLTHLEQLVDSDQTNAVATAFEYVMNHLADDRKTLAQLLEAVEKQMDANGLDGLSDRKGHPGNLARVRKYELAGALNRFRLLKTKSIKEEKI
ncbi:MAG TPA: ATPase, partial [Eubacteriaceae bacterium]|nr:ATPase [Eubacteriaceae bacterium]